MDRDGTTLAMGQAMRHLALLLLMGCSSTADTQTGSALVTRFKCASCHGPDLSGSGSPIGGLLAYAGNLTPDPGTGIGTWPDDAIIAAVRVGDAGSDACPAMPRFPMTDSEAASLVAYLRGLPPVVHAVPTGDCSGPAPNDLDDASAPDAAIIIVPSGP